MPKAVNNHLPLAIYSDQTHWSLATTFIPSNRCGTIFSFRYTRAGAPPGRTFVIAAAERSAARALEAPFGSAILPGERGLGVSAPSAGGARECSEEAGGAYQGRREEYISQQASEQQLAQPIGQKRGRFEGEKSRILPAQRLRRAELWSFQNLRGTIDR